MKKPLSYDVLIALKELMNSMLVEAENGNWQALSHLDAKRRELLNQDTDPNISNKKHKSHILSKENQSSSAYRSLCNEILTLDEKITTTVQEAKHRLVKENRDMRTQIVAKKLYAQTAKIHTPSHSPK